MFFGLGGDELRPTYFELLAAERLMPSLQARSQREEGRLRTCWRPPFFACARV